MGIRTGNPRGRPKGSPNKASAAREEAIKAAGNVTPLEYMLGVLNDPASDPKERAWAANAAAPYVHPKLANVDIGNKNGEAFRVVLDSGDGGII